MDILTLACLGQFSLARVCLLASWLTRLRSALRLGLWRAWAPALGVCWSGVACNCLRSRLETHYRAALGSWHTGIELLGDCFVLRIWETLPFADTSKFLIQIRRRRCRPFHTLWTHETGGS